MTQSDSPQTQTFAADPAGANTGFAAAMLGMRTVALSLLVDRALFGLILRISLRHGFAALLPTFLSNENHPGVPHSEQKLTTAAGAPVGDNQNSKTAGLRGPVVLQDVWLIEKLAHFDREVIPERRVHAKGSGAFGTLKVTHDISRYTKAKVFAEVGKETPLFMRFSTVAGERGAADAERDVRGFAIKFYTEEGNWDLVGNNTPVFFIRDPLKFPDFIHTQKRDPYTNCAAPTATGISGRVMPEALHQVTILMSDRGIPKNYRQMHGFGSHTYIHQRGQRALLGEVPLQIAAGHRESHRCGSGAVVAQRSRKRAARSVREHRRGDFPQLDALHPGHAGSARPQTYRLNPFDITKVWSQKDYPLIDVGAMELNRNAENYFADVEQAAFTPANVVPGIGFSPDRMLQGRLFSYGDTQRYRLGINHHQIPVNAPRVPNPFVPSRRGDAHRRQPRRQRELRAEPLRRLRAGRQRIGAALAAGAVDALRPSRGRRLLHAAGHAVRAL